MPALSRPKRVKHNWKACNRAAQDPAAGIAQASDGEQGKIHEHAHPHQEGSRAARGPMIATTIPANSTWHQRISLNECRRTSLNKTNNRRAVFEARRACKAT